MNGTPLKVLYFARVAELTGTREEAWPLAAPLLHVFMQGAMARSLAAMAAIVSDRGQA